MAISTCARVLVVDDEPMLAETLSLIIRHAGYNASAVNSGEDALAFISENHPSVVVSDVVMPGMSGLDLALAIRKSYPRCQVLLFSGNADTHGLLEAAKEDGNVFEVMAKPVPPPVMLARIASLIGSIS